MRGGANPVTTVAYQGERGAYSEEALIAKYGSHATPLPCPYLEDVFQAVEEGRAEIGLVPVENTIEGAITRTLDLLYTHTLQVTGEAIHRVSHCLIAHPGVGLEELEEVFSHPQALGQCRAFLSAHNLKAIPFHDTAASVRHIKEAGRMCSAAIASQRAAHIHGMQVLARGIEDDPANYTRFLEVGRGWPGPTGRDKTTLAFTLDHGPGNLVEALASFSSRGIGLTKIESRPRVGAPWEYVFFVDVEGHSQEEPLVSALAEFCGKVRDVKVMGSYPKALMPQP